jgi:hypothetical protein
MNPTGLSRVVTAVIWGDHMMRRRRCVLALAPVLALALLSPATVRAADAESPGCKRDLTAASARVSETMVRLKGLAKARRDEQCAAYRAQFLIVVQARAVVASCKTGPDRDSEVGRLDGTIEDINGAIAESCAVQ